MRVNTQYILNKCLQNINVFTYFIQQQTAEEFLFTNQLFPTKLYLPCLQTI